MIDRLKDVAVVVLWYGVWVLAAMRMGGML